MRVGLEDLGTTEGGEDVLFEAAVGGGVLVAVVAVLVVVVDDVLCVPAISSKQRWASDWRSCS